jgi:hypothetical protein
MTQEQVIMQNLNYDFEINTTSSDGMLNVRVTANGKGHNKNVSEFAQQVLDIEIMHMKKISFQDRINHMFETIHHKINNLTN